MLEGVGICLNEGFVLQRSRVQCLSSPSKEPTEVPIRFGVLYL